MGGGVAQPPKAAVSEGWQNTLNGFFLVYNILNYLNKTKNNK